MTYSPIVLVGLLLLIVLETQVLKHLARRYRKGILSQLQTILAIGWPIATFGLAIHAAWYGNGTRLLSVPTVIVCFLLMLFIYEMGRRFLTNSFTQEDVQRLNAADERAAAGQSRKRITKLTIAFDFLPIAFVFNLLAQTLITQYMSR